MTEYVTLKASPVFTVSGGRTTHAISRPGGEAPSRREDDTTEAEFVKDETDSGSNLTSADDGTHICSKTVAKIAKWWHLFSPQSLVLMFKL